MIKQTEISSAVGEGGIPMHNSEQVCLSSPCNPHACGQTWRYVNEATSQHCDLDEVPVGLSVGIGARVCVWGGGTGGGWLEAGSRLARSSTGINALGVVDGDK